MAATIAGAIKAHLESQGWGVAVYRDGAPVVNGREVPAPYITVQEGIGYAPERHGDQGDPHRHGGTTEQVQVDLYLPARAATGQAGRAANAERYDLPTLLDRALDGPLPAYGPTGAVRRVYGMSVVSGQRWPISDNIVRHTRTVSIRRDT